MEWLSHFEDKFIETKLSKEDISNREIKVGNDGILYKCHMSSFEYEYFYTIDIMGHMNIYREKDDGSLVM